MRGGESHAGAIEVTLSMAFHRQGRGHTPRLSSSPWLGRPCLASSPSTKTPAWPAWPAWPASAASAASPAVVPQGSSSVVQGRRAGLRAKEHKLHLSTSWGSCSPCPRRGRTGHAIYHLAVGCAPAYVRFRSSRTQNTFCNWKVRFLMQPKI